MTRDNLDRLTMFCPDGLDVQRLALNMPQVKRYRPPPNPAKMTDSRASDYVAKFGNSSWELDALEPAVIVALVREAVQGLIDYDKWNRALKRQEDGRRVLKTFAKSLEGK